MAKLYTRTEWARLMNRLPEEDRTSYDQSPDVPEYTVRPTTAKPTAAATTTSSTGTSASKVRAGDEASVTTAAPSGAESATLENAVISREERINQLRMEREARMAAEANARAASNPMFDFRNRPEAPPADDQYIYYYSWIGGVNTGQWRLYRVRNN